MSAVETIARKLGGPIVLGRDVQTQMDLAIAVQRGLPLVALEGLARTGFSNREIELLVISRRTRRRRAALGRSLTTQESDRTIRLLRIQTLAEETFSNADQANLWLRRPKVQFDDKTPLEFLQTDIGARLVEERLAKIAWGIAA